MLRSSENHRGTLSDPRLPSPAIVGRHKPVKLTRTQKLGRFMRLAAASGFNADKALRLAKSREWDDGNTDWQTRALVSGIGASGGFLVPDVLYPTMIELLRNRAVVRRLGAVRVEMPAGNVRMTRLQGGATASYAGEAAATNASQETFGALNFSARKAISIVPVSNDLLKFASPRADEFVVNDMIEQLAVTEDQAFIRGAGTQFTPRGMRSWAAAANILTSAGTGLNNFVADLTAIESALENNNVRMLSPALILNPRSKNAIKLLQSTTGSFVFRDEMKDGTLNGYPYGYTNGVPNNLGTGAQTEWYLVDMADAIIADVPGLDIEMSRDAAYVDASGVMRAAFSEDVTVIKVVAQHDFGMRHDVSVAVMTAVNY
jgi:HK97 family phage major capsid protein